MRIHASLWSLALTLIGASALQAQRPVEVAPNAPPDRPVSAATSCQMRALYKAMQPSVDQARATWPNARRRFQEGLPAKHTMFVTTRLRDAGDREEQVFVVVDSVAGDHVIGRIWSQIHVVAGFRLGQSYSLKDAAILDWMIARPDGSEEGNVVGKFIETYTPPASCRDA